MKITDVGISKPAIDITGTLAGTPVYIAPEVFRCEVYDCKADIYCLGITLWEIWYGEWAYFNVQVKAMTDLLKKGDQRYRPQHVKSCNKPPLRWEHLMSTCWKGNPEEHPTAKECNEEVSKLSDEVEV